MGMQFILLWSMIWKFSFPFSWHALITWTLLLSMHMYVKPNDKIEDNSNMIGVEVS
jgi:hypothetical protein